MALRVQYKEDANKKLKSNPLGWKLSYYVSEITFTPGVANERQTRWSTIRPT